MWNPLCNFWILWESLFSFVKLREYPIGFGIRFVQNMEHLRKERYPTPSVSAPWFRYALLILYVNIVQLQCFEVTFPNRGLFSNGSSNHLRKGPSSPGTSHQILWWMTCGRRLKCHRYCATFMVACPSTCLMPGNPISQPIIGKSRHSPIPFWVAHIVKFVKL